MKTITKIALAFGCAAAASTSFAMDGKGWASSYESLAAFDSKIFYYGNRPDYVKPIIDNLGNVLNSNWYVSANVPQSLTFEVGLPFSLILVGNDDQVYQDELLGERPTIFGDHGDPLVYNMIPGSAGLIPDHDGDLTNVIYGNKNLNALGVFTYPYLQMAAGFYHARVVLRGMVLPSISNLTKFNLFGFGLQYSFGHFFQYMLPPAAQGFDVSLAFGYSTSGIGYRPDDFKGSLDLDVSATTFDVVLGYKPVDFVEVMMTLGYQSSTMESSGNLYQVREDFMGHEIVNPDGSLNKYHEINPDISVDGNCGFKFGLAVAFQFGGAYHPVVGFDYGGKSSFTTNALYFRQQFGTDKTPDEIAQEKGYVRGASKAEEQKIHDEAVQQEVRDEANNAYENEVGDEGAVQETDENGFGIDPEAQAEESDDYDGNAGSEW